MIQECFRERLNPCARFMASGPVLELFRVAESTRSTTWRGSDSDAKVNTPSVVPSGAIRGSCVAAKAAMPSGSRCNGKDGLEVDGRLGLAGDQTGVVAREMICSDMTVI